VKIASSTDVKSVPEVVFGWLWKFPVNIISIIMGNKMRQGILAQLQDELGTLKELCE
jgi:hypothetical protein